MKIIDLYKKHINKTPDGLELHKFLSNFNLNSIYVKHYDKQMEKEQQLQYLKKVNLAEIYILKNSKLNK